MSLYAPNSNRHTERENIVKIQLVIEKIVRIIQDKRTDIEQMIVELRRSRQTYDQMSNDEHLVATLESIGAKKSVIRSVIARICQGYFDNEEAAEIHRHSLANRESNLTPEARAKGARESQLCDWTEEIETNMCTIIELFHGKGHKWEMVALNMEALHGITLEPKQWFNRYRYLQSRKKFV